MGVASVLPLSAATFVTFDGTAGDGEFILASGPYVEAGVRLTPGTTGRQGFLDNDVFTLQNQFQDDAFFFESPDSSVVVTAPSGTFDFESSRLGGIAPGTLRFSGTFVDGTQIQSNLNLTNTDAQVQFFSGFENLRSLNISSTTGDVYLDNIVLELGTPVPPPGSGSVPQTGQSQVLFNNNADDGEVVIAPAAFDEAGYLFTQIGGQFLDDDAILNPEAIDDDAFFFDTSGLSLQVGVSAGLFDLDSAKFGGLDISSSLSFEGVFPDQTSIFADISVGDDPSDFALFSGFKGLQNLIVTSGGSGQVYLDNLFLTYDPGVTAPPAPVPTPAALPMFGAVFGVFALFLRSRKKRIK